MQKMQSTPQLQQQWSKMRTQPHCIEIYPPFQYRYDDFNPGTRDRTGSYLHTALVKDEKKSDSLVAQVKKSHQEYVKAFSNHCRLSIWQDVPKNIHRCSNGASFRSSLTKHICMTMHVILMHVLMLINTVFWFGVFFCCCLIWHCIIIIFHYFHNLNWGIMQKFNFPKERIFNLLNSYLK